MNLIAEIEAGNTQKIKSFYEDKPDKFKEDIKFVDSKGMTPLHYACKFGYLPLVKMILSCENSKDIINLQDSQTGWTPLIYAIYSQDDGGPEIVALLLNNNADLNMKDKDGNTALHHAAGFGAGEAIEYVCRHKGSSLDVQNNKGETPAHMAIKESQMWAFQTLLKEGCRIDLLTNENDSLAHYAVKSIGNSNQFLRTLASKGANLNLKNQNGQTPLSIAKEKKFTRIVVQLVELGVIDEEPEKKVQPKRQQPQVSRAGPQLDPRDNTQQIVIYIILAIVCPILLSFAYKVLYKGKKFY